MRFFFSSAFLGHPSFIFNVKTDVSAKFVRCGSLWTCTESMTSHTVLSSPLRLDLHQRLFISYTPVFRAGEAEWNLELFISIKNIANNISCSLE